MSNLNLSGFSNPLYGNQHYKSIVANAGSVDASKSALSNSFEEFLSVNIDLSKRKKNTVLNGAGGVGDYIKLTPLPVMDPHCLITALTFDGNNSIDSEDFEVELGVLYGPDPSTLSEPVPITGTVEYVQIVDFDPCVAGPKQTPGKIVEDPGMNVGQVQLVSDGASILPMAYNQGNLGTPVLRIITAQDNKALAGNVNVKVKWVRP